MNENMGSTQQDFPPDRSRDFMDGKAIFAKKIKDNQRQRTTRSLFWLGERLTWTTAGGTAPQEQSHMKEKQWGYYNFIWLQKTNLEEDCCLCFFNDTVSSANSQIVEKFKRCCLLVDGISYVCVWIFSGTELSMSVLDVCTFFVHLSH